MFIYMANIGSILATAFKFLYSKMCRCSHHPDLPKKATLPSKSDASSYLDEEVISRQSSNSKASYEDSISGFSSGSRKATIKSQAFKNIVELARKKNSVIINSEAQIVEAVSSEAKINNNNVEERFPKKSIIQKFSSKFSKSSDAGWVEMCEFSSKIISSIFYI